ncbi:cupin domain-containing protein [Haloarchaeobius sp. HME9146]|uniref:cupin domain-containing protein n=1 Tax=Haloarchaeobius sp. HME9146 TaxID=2978732 RepID=UPI0021BE3549|nr:cupin domain-containing protein [Haloarchaeobius sp. HME9146]MCT9098493.1 cupin domain-containing protein [Haloarchaeobius sp. HME9146]
MEHVDIDDIESQFLGDSDLDRRGLSDPLGTSDLAINYYSLEPGESFSGGMHTHLDQEEVFYVIQGTATFETPDESVEVGPHEAIRFARGEYQQGTNESDEQVVGLALGAPKGSEDVRVPMGCRECGESDSLQFIMGEDGEQLRCPECGMTKDI